MSTTHIVPHTKGRLGCVAALHSCSIVVRCVRNLRSQSGEQHLCCVYRIYCFSNPDLRFLCISTHLSSRKTLPNFSLCTTLTLHLRDSVSNNSKRAKQSLVAECPLFLATTILSQTRSCLDLQQNISIHSEIRHSWTSGQSDSAGVGTIVQHLCKHSKRRRSDHIGTFTKGKNHMHINVTERSTNIMVAESASFTTAGF